MNPNFEEIRSSTCENGNITVGKPGCGESDQLF